LADLAYKIIRSKRRSIALVVNKDACLEVRAPLKVSLKSIEEFIDKNRTWIEEKKDFVNKNRHRTFPKKFVDGEHAMYEGSSYKIQIIDCEEIDISDFLYFPKKFLPQANQRLIIWYKYRAIKKITERVNYFASMNQLQYKVVRITSAEGIWGSCNAKGSLSVNWRLIMAPPDILDYIVVHELTHLIVRNHSKLFWSKVAEIMPDYKTHETWLKKNGSILML